MRKFFFLLTFFSLSVGAAHLPEGGSYLLPLTCSELLPDMTPYIVFFESLGRGNVTKDRRFSKRIFRLLALREKLADLSDRSKEQNPIDILIRKTLCYYREQKEPLKPVPYDDPEFLKFIKSSLKDLEMRVDDAVYQVELERQLRQEYERRALKNQSVADSLMREANIEADSTFHRLSSSARRKAKTQ